MQTATEHKEWGYYRKALCIRPCRFRKALNSNKSIFIELAFIHKVGCFLPTFWDNKLCTKPPSSCFQRFQWILLKIWHSFEFSQSSIFCKSSHFKLIVDPVDQKGRKNNGKHWRIEVQLYQKKHKTYQGGLQRSVRNCFELAHTKEKACKIKKRTDSQKAGGDEKNRFTWVCSHYEVIEVAHK